MSKHTSKMAAMNYPIDAKFISLIDDFKIISQMQIYHLMIGRFKAFHTETRGQFEDYCMAHPLLGSLNSEREDFTVFENRSKALHDHWVDFVWLYQVLKDYRSRHVLFAFLNNWYYYDMNSLNAVRESLYPAYFDMEVIRCGSDEVYVDVGASVAASVNKYMSTYGKYKHIYCYELSPENMKSSGEKLIKYKNVSLLDTGGMKIDDDISEPATFIKINSDGLEQQTLLGCGGQIKNNKPKLAIAVHNNNENIWKIPRMIDEICPGYGFYLRYHGKAFCPTSLILLAVCQ